MKDIFRENQIVAVYGTLKKGYGNHRLLESSTFIGSGETVNKYRLCISGLPFLIAGESSEGHNIDVEVYDCNAFEMYDLDLLEGHPRFYKRELTEVKVNGESVSAWVYFVPDNQNYNSGEYFKTYSGRRELQEK
jgi:gamma-glutamylcyclotransferase (GGCT)/AIG2-like uncharacterized protein YtfP|tara:strand:+ start:206 stop:607 length:402 start_codon:yes stop_codon:yes gene_type:complete